MELTLHFFFNLSLLIVLLFFSLIWLENTKKVQFIATLYCFASLIICYGFSYPLSENILLDLRNIPFVIGALYIGLGPYLGLTAIIIRAFFGIDLGFWVTVSYYAIFSLILWKIHPWFLGKNREQRIWIAIGFIYIVGIYQTTPLLFMLDGYDILDVSFAFLFLQPLGVGMITYFLEEVDKFTIYRQQLVTLERQGVVEKMGAAISHEIRNPLTAAIGFVQLLHNDSISADTKRQYLSIVKSELQSAERVIQDYLTISKVDPETENTILINKALNQVIQMLIPLAQNRSVEIITDFAEESIIMGDSQKFHQSLVNIMKNGIESMSSGGILTVGTEATPTNVVITIKDTGSGMTDEQLSRLGEPYYSTKGNQGTGLGILVVFSVIRAMNGNIHVESEVGVGTTFELNFRSSLAYIPPVVEQEKGKMISK
ncbi:HAMP domain-containing sensor histidine kinase [Psychrobacillus sp. BL-248-WT-3]|uniref:sensor histidine kinase n=1 Tax=Psychrobacillus sp. BL-248-WT-3 TaxID=2725306 RepID=UPI00146B493B|nr:HAMP domain-containing sensor histidine kinase [Psychrobacillus sp. BL-248-WT-3]NME05353.1 HAMP domain-containing histidine kinase [Psychrobacillus sp. BL-248-WT-3]